MQIRKKDGDPTWFSKKGLRTSHAPIPELILEILLSEIKMKAEWSAILGYLRYKTEGICHTQNTNSSACVNELYWDAVGGGGKYLAIKPELIFFPFLCSVKAPSHCNSKMKGVSLCVYFLTWSRMYGQGMTDACNQLQWSMLKFQSNPLISLLSHKPKQMCTALHLLQGWGGSFVT